MLGITNVSNAPSIVLRDTIAGDNLKPWVSGSYNGYSYRCAIPITGVTANTIAEVTFSQAQAESGNYSSVCTTYDGGLYIYAKVNTTIEIPSIIIHSIVESYYEMENSPVSGSTKAVTSGGVYDALENLVTTNTNQKITETKGFLTSKINIYSSTSDRTQPTNLNFYDLNICDKNGLPAFILRFQDNADGVRQLNIGFWKKSDQTLHWYTLAGHDCN